LPWARQEGLKAQAKLSLGGIYSNTQKMQLLSLSQSGHYLPAPISTNSPSEVFSTFNAYIPSPWRRDLPDDRMNLTLYTEDREVIGHTTVSLRRLLGERDAPGANGQSFWKRTLQLSTNPSPDHKNVPKKVSVDVEIQYASLTEKELSKRKRLSKSISQRIEKLKSFNPRQEQPIFDPRQWRGPTGCSRDWRAISSRVGGNAVEAADMEGLCFVEHLGTDTQVKLWRDEKRKRIVVAFRGTDFLQWRDLLTDLKIMQELWNITSIAQEHTTQQRTSVKEPRVKAQGKKKKKTKIFKKLVTKAVALVSKCKKSLKSLEAIKRTSSGSYHGGVAIPVAAVAPPVEAEFRGSRTDSYGPEGSWMSSILGVLHGAYEVVEKSVSWAIPHNVSLESLWSWVVFPVSATAGAASAVLQPTYAKYIQYVQWGEVGYVSSVSNYLNGVVDSVFKGTLQLLSPPVSILGSTVEKAMQAVQTIQPMGWSSSPPTVPIAPTASPSPTPTVASQDQPSARPKALRNPIMDLLRLDWESQDSSFIPMVHGGFKEAYLSVRKPLMEMIEVAGGGRKKMEEENWRIMCTGHSLGGALATLMCQDLSRNYPRNRVSMYSFGAPKVGNAAFMQQYHRDNRDSFRLVNDIDVVPRFPSGSNTSIFNYEHVGRTVILGTTGDHIASGLPIWVSHDHDALLIPPPPPWCFSDSRLPLPDG